MATITSIGIGNMGAALAHALLTSSTPPTLTLWNRNPSRPTIPPLLALGARLQPSLATAIAASTTLLICLTDYPSITSALASLSKENPQDTQPLRGKTILNLTNGTPAQSRTMAASLKALGAAAYFDGGIMVTPQLVGSPASFVVLSGETEARYAERVAGVLAPIGAVKYVGEEVGAAALWDVAALAGMYGMFTGAFTAIALLQRQRGAGRMVKGAVDGVVVPVLKALVPYVGLLAECVDKGEWKEDLGNPMGMQVAAMRNILQACEEEGVDGSGLGFLMGLMEKAVDEGFTEGGVAPVARYMSK